MDQLSAHQGVLLPIAWLILSLIAAFIMYFTSKVAISATDIFGFPVKSVRIGGSVAIFLVVFLVLQQATRANTIVVPREHIERLAEAVRDMDNSRVDVTECVMTNALDTANCRNSVDEMRRRSEEVKRRADTITLTIAPQS